jgi:hypothetical protein
MRLRHGLLLLAAASGGVGLASSSCDSGKPPPSGDDGTGPAYDSGYVLPDASKKPDGGSAADGQTDQEAATGDATSESDGVADAPADDGFVDVPTTPPTDASMVEPTCNPNAKLGTSTAVPGLPTFTTQPFITMTGDELTMAWVLPNAGSAEAGTAGTGVFVADRATPSDSFGTATAIVAILDGGSFFAPQRVAISSDGLTVIAIEAGGKNMASFIRTARGQAFAPFDVTSPYAEIVQSLNPGEMLADPVVSSDSDDLVFTKYGLGSSISVYESFRSGTSPWPTPTPRTLTLQASGSSLKHPLSLSQDRLTLFVWDDSTSAAYGAFRNTPMADYSILEPYGSLVSLQTNAACNRFYFVSASGSTYTVQQAPTM